MYFKKTMQLVSTNYRVHLKSLVAQILALCLIAAIFSWFFISFANVINDVIKQNGLIGGAQDILNDLFNWDDVIAEEFPQKLADFFAKVRDSINAIPDFSAKFSTAVLFAIIVAYLYYFVFGLAVYPTFCIVNRFMATNTRTYFLWTMFKNFGVGIRFVAMRALLFLFLDWTAFMISAGTYILVFVNLGLAGVIFALLVMMFMFGIRNALFAYWLPVTVNECDKVSQSLKKCIVVMMDDFWWLLLKSLVIVCIGTILCAAALLLFKTLVAFILIVLLISFASYVLNTWYFVSYYENKKKPYFVKGIVIKEEND